MPQVKPDPADFLEVLPTPEQEYLKHWKWWLRNARDNQLPPDDKPWFLWLLLAGRGFGKTRCGAEEVANRMLETPNLRVCMGAPTTGDIRDTMCEGESGLLNIIPEKLIHKWNRSLLELVLVNGSRAKGFSAETPERLRGPQHNFAWLDEVAAFGPNLQMYVDMLLMGLRLGEYPQMIVTTTPKPLLLLKEWIKAPDTHLVTGSTFENMANLPQKFKEKLVEKYQGTRIGRQELYAEILEDFENSFLKHEQIKHLESAPETLSRVVIGVDPAGTSGNKSDSTGIIAAGRDYERRGYVLGDYTMRGSPEAWSNRAVLAYHDHKADLIVAEKNYGGDMVKSTIQSADPSVPVKLVHASRGKLIRAEPIIMKYEQGKIFHVGDYAELESQLCAFTPEGYELEGSPDHADAAVWAFTELLLGGRVMDPVVPVNFSRARSPSLEVNR